MTTIKLDLNLAKRWPKANKTEQRFGNRLALLHRTGEIAWLDFEPVKLRLGAACFYTPDFLAVENDRLVAYEVKGFWRDDARVKIKAAAKMYPWIHFIAVMEGKKGTWKFEEIS